MRALTKVLSFLGNTRVINITQRGLTVRNTPCWAESNKKGNWRTCVKPTMKPPLQKNKILSKQRIQIATKTKLSYDDELKGLNIFVCIRKKSVSKYSVYSDNDAKVTGALPMSPFFLNEAMRETPNCSCTIRAKIPSFPSWK